MPLKGRYHGQGTSSQPSRNQITSISRQVIGSQAIDSNMECIELADRQVASS